MNLNEYNALISEIKFKSGLNEGEICKEIGYVSNYISQIRTNLNNGEAIPMKFIQLLKAKWDVKKVVKDSRVDITGQMAAVLARQRVQGHYLAVLLSEIQDRPLEKILEEMNRMEQGAS
jgi:hypothetical protein